MSIVPLAPNKELLIKMLNIETATYIRGVYRKTRFTLFYYTCLYLYKNLIISVIRYESFIIKFWYIIQIRSFFYKLRDPTYAADTKIYYLFFCMVCIQFSFHFCSVCFTLVHLQTPETLLRMIHYLFFLYKRI